MTNIKIKLCVVLFLGLGLSSTYAQEATTASGGDASGSGGSVAYSVGQVDYITNSGTTGSANQGVQQPFEIFQVGIKDAVVNIQLSIYPNPTNNNLTLQVKDFNNEKLTFYLYDMQGKLIVSKQIVSNHTIINTGGLTSATYFLNIVQKNKTLHSLKIIKN